MAEYRVSDLALLPNLLSGARLPLAVAFPLASANAPLALGILGFAGLTDVLDGWAARKLGQATPVGALVDGVSDKVFAASVLGTLVATGMLSPAAALLLATRELGELPLALRVLASKRARLTAIDRKANKLGKLATVLEFTTVLAVIAKAPGKNVLLAATAVCGVAAAASYWWREIRALGAGLTPRATQATQAPQPPRAPQAPRSSAAPAAPAPRRGIAPTPWRRPPSVEPLPASSRAASRSAAPA